MPHVIIEHSANIDRRNGGSVDVGALVTAMHRAALDTGIAPLDALRTRAASREHVAIADEDPAHGFVAVVARLGAGRSAADKRSLVAALMDALRDHLGPAEHDLMLSVEYQEIDPEFRLNVNHVRQRLADRSAARTSGSSVATSAPDPETS